MRSFKGTPISPGVAIGKVVVVKPDTMEIKLVQGCVQEDEKNRFHEARNLSIKQVESIYNQMTTSKGADGAAVFLAHIEMLDDIYLIERTEAIIEELGCNAEWAVQAAQDEIVELFNTMEDDYMRERAIDVKDICKRVLRNLQGAEDSHSLELLEPSIVVARELSPSDTAQMNHELVLGIINEVGGTTSHAAIIARILGIPFILLPEIMSQAKNDQLIALDGEQGIVELDVNEAILLEYEKKKEDYQNKLKLLEKLIGTKSITKDGYEVQLAGNIGSLNDLDAVIGNDGEGVGLFRTEFLYMNRNQAPEEEEQFEAYKTVAEKMVGKPVIIRTLDIGGDKQVDYLNIPREENPFLGFRAIRFCLERKSLWKVQLRALLRASAYGDIHIMFPMIVSMEELRQAKQLLEEVKEELTREGISYNDKIPVGMMMETPAAAIMADMFAKEVDFFSIGTNDLIQYTMAVDRMNGQVAYLYSQYDPAVLRLIHTITKSAQEHGIWVGICGEAAADHKLIPLWVGLGVTELSMSASSILQARERIQKLSKDTCDKIRVELFNCHTAKEVEVLLDTYISQVLI